MHDRSPVMTGERKRQRETKSMTQKVQKSVSQKRQNHGFLEISWANLKNMLML